MPPVPPRFLRLCYHKAGAYEPQCKKDHQTSVLILRRITLQNVSCMDFNLLVLMSFEGTAMNSQQPTCCIMSPPAET